MYAASFFLYLFVIKKYQILLNRRPEGCTANAQNGHFCRFGLEDIQCQACFSQLLVLHLQRTQANSPGLRGLGDGSSPPHTPDVSFISPAAAARVISEYVSHVPVYRCETKSLKVNIFSNFLSFPFLSFPFLFAPQLRFHSTALCAASQRWGPHVPETCGCTVEALFAQIKVCYEWTFAPSEHDDVQFDRITH